MGGGSKGAPRTYTGPKGCAKNRVGKINKEKRMYASRENEPKQSAAITREKNSPQTKIKTRHQTA